MAVNNPNLLGDHSIMDPPDHMPNSVVKRNSADGSVGSPHVRVGHRQALISTCLNETSQHNVLCEYIEFYVDFQSRKRIIRLLLKC